MQRHVYVLDAMVRLAGVAILAAGVALGLFQADLKAEALASGPGGLEWVCAIASTACFCLGALMIGFGARLFRSG